MKKNSIHHPFLLHPILDPLEFYEISSVSSCSQHLLSLFWLCAVYWCSNLWNPSRINCRANIKVSWTHLFSIPVSCLLPMKLVTQSEDNSHSWPHSWDTRTCFKAPPPTVLLSKVCRPLLCQGIKRKKTTMCSAVNTLAISAFPQLLLLTNYS